MDASCTQLGFTAGAMAWNCHKTSFLLCVMHVLPHAAQKNHCSLKYLNVLPLVELQRHKKAIVWNRVAYLPVSVLLNTAHNPLDDYKMFLFMKGEHSEKRETIRLYVNWLKHSQFTFKMFQHLLDSNLKEVLISLGPVKSPKKCIITFIGLWNTFHPTSICVQYKLILYQIAMFPLLSQPAEKAESFLFLISISFLSSVFFLCVTYHNGVVIIIKSITWIKKRP